MADNKKEKVNWLSLIADIGLSMVIGTGVTTILGHVIPEEALGDNKYTKACSKVAMHCIGGMIGKASTDYLKQEVNDYIEIGQTVRSIAKRNRRIKRYIGEEVDADGND